MIKNPLKNQKRKLGEYNCSMNIVYVAEYPLRIQNVHIQKWLS